MNNTTGFLILAQAPAPAKGQPNLLVSMMPLVFIFVIFYFLLIRTQKKKQKDIAAASSTNKISMNYYLWINDTRRGPYSIEQIRHMWLAGQMTKNTKVWHDGLKDWMDCGAIESELSSPAQLIKSENLIIHTQIKNQGIALLLALLFPGLGGVYSGFFTFAFGVASVTVFVVGFYQRDSNVYWGMAGVLQFLAILACAVEVESFNKKLLSNHPVESRKVFFERQENDNLQNRLFEAATELQKVSALLGRNSFYIACKVFYDISDKIDRFKHTDFSTIELKNYFEQVQRSKKEMGNYLSTNHPVEYQKIISERQEEVKRKTEAGKKEGKFLLLIIFVCLPIVFIVVAILIALLTNHPALP